MFKSNINETRLISILLQGVCGKWLEIDLLELIHVVKCENQGFVLD